MGSSPPMTAKRNGKYLPVATDNAPYRSGQPHLEFKPSTNEPPRIHPADYHRIQNETNQTSPIAVKNGRIAAIKYCIYGFNLVFLVVGFILMTTGAWVRTDSRFREFLSERYRNVAQEAFWQAPTLYFFSYILIVLGACMIVVSFFGCCGAIRESGCLLITYFCCVLLLFVACLSCGIYLMYKKDSIENELSDALDYMVQHYYQGAGVVQEALDHLQQTFRCCGNAGCSDFRDYRKDVPRSCDLRCDGCRYRMWDALRIGATITSILMFVVLIAQLLAMAMSLYLFCAKRTPMEQYIVHTYYRNEQKMPPPDQKLSFAEYTRRTKLQKQRPMQMRPLPPQIQDENFYAVYDTTAAPPTTQWQQPPPSLKQPATTQWQQPSLQQPMYREPNSRLAPPPYHSNPRG